MAAILNDSCQVCFASPETILENKEWIDVFQSQNMIPNNNSFHSPPLGLGDSSNITVTIFINSNITIVNISR